MNLRLSQSSVIPATVEVPDADPVPTPAEATSVEGFALLTLKVRPKLAKPPKKDPHPDFGLSLMDT